MSEKLKPLKPYEPNWPHGYCTRDGWPARVICTDAKGEFPIVALISKGNGDEEEAATYRCDERFCTNVETQRDLMCAAPPEPGRKLIERWFVMSARAGFLGMHTSRKAAEEDVSEAYELSPEEAPHRVVHMREVRE